MQKPEYELTPLRMAVQQCRINILAFQNGIAKEENQIDKLQDYIGQWETYNRWKDGDTNKSISEP